MDTVTEITEDTELPTWAASYKQRKYIAGLLDEREINDPAWESVVRELIRRVDFPKSGNHSASELIGTLLKLPKKPRTSSSPRSTGDLDKLATGKFAIPVSLLSARLTDLAGHSDLLFGEVREYKGRRFINVLKGAPGAFARTRLAKELAFGREEVTQILIKDQYKYVKLFGEHYRCCGSCGAELSDETSRRLQLGPECRKKFGL